MSPSLSRDFLDFLAEAKRRLLAATPDGRQAILDELTRKCRARFHTRLDQMFDRFVAELLLP